MHVCSRACPLCWMVAWRHKIVLRGLPRISESHQHTFTVVVTPTDHTSNLDDLFPRHYLMEHLLPVIIALSISPCSLKLVLPCWAIGDELMSSLLEHHVLAQR